MSLNKSFYIILFISIIPILGHFFFGFSSVNTSGHAIGSDDAYITYKYAYNFYNGNGIVYNINEYVEGYSNFLYLLIISIGFFFTTENIYIYSVLVNIVFFFITLFVFYKILKLQYSKTISLVAISLIALNPIIWANINTGLETILVLLIFVSIWYVLKLERNFQNNFLLFLLITLSIASRVDGFILPLIVVIYLFLSTNKALSIRIFFYIVFVMILYTLFRIYYYDDVIANTYYAKVSGNIMNRIESGITFIYKESIYNGLAFYTFFIIFFYMKRKNLNLKNIISFELIFFVSWLSYILYIGGDIYHERFLLPFLLLGIYYFSQYIQNLSVYKKFSFVIIGILLSLGVFFKDGRFSYEKRTYDMWVHLGLFLKEIPKDYILAIDAAGKVPFYSQLQIIDMLGLNNKNIGKKNDSSKSFSVGHNKFDPDYVISKKPHLIAAWINSEQDMFWDLYRFRYEKDYILKYIVNSTRQSKEVNIHNITKMSKKDVKNLILQGYNYGVLMRKDLSTSLSTNAKN